MLALDLERLTTNSINTANSLKVRSALNPMLWLCCVVIPVLLGAAWAFSGHPWLSEFLAISAVFISFMSVGAYWYLAIKKPEQLRSEEFQLRQQALQIYREKTGVVKSLPMSVEKILVPPRRQGGDV